MPRNASGTYNLPVGNPVESGEVIASVWANTTLNDVGVALTDSLDRYGRGGMLAPFEFADGTNLSPGATWTNEPSTGFYRFDGGDLRVAVLTQDVMRWQQSGAQIWNETDLQWEGILTDGGSGSQTSVDVGTVEGQTLRWNNTDLKWEATSASALAGVAVAAGRIISDGAGAQDISGSFGISSCVIDNVAFRCTLITPITITNMCLTATSQASSEGLLGCTLIWISDTEFDVAIVDALGNTYTVAGATFGFTVHDSGR
jgi:hypothetical protein